MMFFSIHLKSYVDFDHYLRSAHGALVLGCPASPPADEAPAPAPRDHGAAVPAAGGGNLVTLPPGGGGGALVLEAQGALVG